MRNRGRRGRTPPVPFGPRVIGRTTLALDRGEANARTMNNALGFAQCNSHRRSTMHWPLANKCGHRCPLDSDGLQAALICFLNAAHLFRCAAAIRLRAAGDIKRLAECPDLPEAWLLLTPSNAAIARLRWSRSCRSLAITASKVGNDLGKA